jgi:signal transduction histidine kinase
LIEIQKDGKSVREVMQLKSRDIAMHELAPLSDWRGISEPEHFVQFYETDSFLLNSLSDFIGAGLCAGDACIVVAREAYREGLDERLRANGLDVAAASACGQYVSLDASETLSRLTIDGTPDAGRFVETIGGIIERAAAGQRRVRIFGEMVALLWAEEKHSAALRLEELWNHLGETHSYSLFCAYPLSGFAEESLAGALGDVCTAHSRVVPAESYTALTNADERLRTIIQLQQKVGLLEMARAEAERANRLKDEFLATISHELRTPLTAILGWANMLRSGSLDESTAARAVETIERNARSQAQLIEDILDVSRAFTGKLRLIIGPVDAASVINAAIDSVQLAAETKGVKLEVALDASACCVSGDAGRLQQVLWNLLSNSIKFTPSGGRIEVRLERAGGPNLQIRVSDTGEGISRDFLPFIFDRFRQADGSSTRTHGGLGLGLAIVRYLVELHGGTVRAESPGAGYGATFTIMLPLASSHEHAEGR